MCAVFLTLIYVADFIWNLLMFSIYHVNTFMQEPVKRCPDERKYTLCWL